MRNLGATLEGLAADFAANVLQAVRSASLDELLVLMGERGAANARRAPAKSQTRVRPAGGRLNRRTPEAIGEMVESIATLLAEHGEGLRAEQIRASLGVEAKELPRPLADGLRDGRFTKAGQKRATTYFPVHGAKRPAKKKTAG